MIRRTAYAVAALALALAALALAARSAPARTAPARAASARPVRWWRPGPERSWMWQLNWPVNLSHRVAVYDIDYDASEQGTRAQVKADVARLHAKGVKVICYLETGSWEDYRPDAREYSPAWLGKRDYPDERYVNMNALFNGSRGPTGLTLRRILDRRFAQCKAEGFDGVETDIDDTYAENTGFRISMRLNERFNETLAHDIHADGLAWFLKNGVHETPTGYDSFLADQLRSANAPDGTINEQCWQYDECGGLRPFTRAHKPILNSEYTGKQPAICGKARTFPMATALFTVALDGTVRWHCWR